MAVKTYDPKQVTVIVGTRPISGFADGTFITVARNSDMWSLVVGADGEATRAKSNDKSGRITITLTQSAESNQYLSELALADELSNGGLVPILIRDASGKTIHACASAWIVKRPESAFAKEAGTREWVFETDTLEMFEGGN
jgi:hypothetical protein